MIRFTAFVPVLISSIAISTAISHAAAVPAGLFNKTITLTWNIQMTVKNAAGETQTLVAPRERVIYVSEQGRLFVRERRSDGRSPLGHTEERAPGNTTNYTGNASSVRFEGNQLVAITGQVSGANIMRATFDQGFTACSMTWAAGKSTSGQTTWKGSNGVTYQIVSATAGASSCSVRAGNGFAG